MLRYLYSGNPGLDLSGSRDGLASQLEPVGGAKLGFYSFIFRERDNVCRVKLVCI